MRRVAVLAAVATVLAVPSAAGLAGDGEASVGSQCSPPCGEINPRITFAFADLPDDPVNLSAGESRTYEGTVSYWADTDDEGYAPRDPTQEIVIRFSFPRLPAWADMSVEPTEITVPVNQCPTCFQVDADGSQPTAHFEYNEEIELTVTANEQPEATTGYDYGKLQLFAKSTESAIYNPGYGIREVRVQPAEPLETQSSDPASPVPGPGALAALATLAGAAALLRRA